MDKQSVEQSLVEFNACDEAIYERSYFDEHTGGYIAAHRQRIAHSQMNKTEREKFAKELSMAMVFAKNGYRIELLEEVAGISSPDARINGVLADFKQLSSHNNIVKEAKSALRHQGAALVLFAFEKMTDKIQQKLSLLLEMGIPYYYFVWTEGDTPPIATSAG